MKVINVAINRGAIDGPQAPGSMHETQPPQGDLDDLPLDPLEGTIPRNAMNL